MPEQKPIYVTQPHLAPLEEVQAYLSRIWSSKVVSHNGPLIQQLENDLKQKLGLRYMSIVLNGTLGLQMAIKALDLKGEIITTPFTYVATLCAINWEGCTPVYCDIDTETFNMDPDKIEELITPETVAIMPVHVFGTACDIERIEAIARKHHLKVIYDAAHAIGTRVKGNSIFNYGDISVTSLHATKIFNTGEGGACMANSEELDEKLQRIRFYGHDENREISVQGTNGKMTEIHAAIGLANLKYFDVVLHDRKLKYQLYKKLLSDLPQLRYQKIEREETNYAYFPVVFESEAQLLKVENALKANLIFPRRYFYPSVNLYKDITTYQPTPVSEDLSKRILCLPLYYALKVEEMERVVKMVAECLAS